MNDEGNELGQPIKRHLQYNITEEIRAKKRKLQQEEKESDGKRN